jgi:hypothetical protein
MGGSEPASDAADPTDALAHDLRRPVHLTEHDVLAVVLEAIEPGAGPEGDDQQPGVAAAEPVLGLPLLPGVLGAGVEDWGEVGEVLQPQGVDGPVPAEQDGALFRLEQHSDVRRDRACLGDAGGLPHFRVELARLVLARGVGHRPFDDVGVVVDVLHDRHDAGPG